jgi:hypothetical protein
MGLIGKGDLKYKYSWEAYGGDDPEVTGAPDSTLFNRKEGYEVLYLINKFMKKNGMKKKVSGQHAEMLINKHLPGNIRSQAKVIKWLNDNWNEYD